MRRIRNIPLIIGICVGLLLLFLVSLRGAFRSSLLSDTSYTPLTTMEMLPPLTGTGAQFEPFTVFAERDQTYQTNLDVLKTSGNLGVYFPHIYRISSERVSVSGGGSIDVALHTRDDLTFENSIAFTIEYPADLMTYAGATTASNALGTITANAVARPGFLDVVFVPSEGKKVFAYQQIDPMLRIPFTFTNIAKVDLTKPVMLRVTSGKKMATNLVEVAFPVQDRPVDLLYFEGSALVDGVIESRGVVTGEVIPTTEDRQKQLEAQRALLTLESPAVDVMTPPAEVVAPTSVSTPSSNVLANTAPEVTADQTRVSPSSLTAGDTTPVYIYLSISDGQGIGDIRQVSIDLSSIGMEADRALLLVNTGPRYGLYATTFSVPVTLAGSDVAYTLPYVIRDRGGNEVQGALSLLIRPKPVTAPQASLPAVTPTALPTSVPQVSTQVTQPVVAPVPTYYQPYPTYPTGYPPSPTYAPYGYPTYQQPTYTQPVSGGQSVYVVEVDMDRNGVVDANDLQLFLQAYQQLSTKR